MIALISRPRLFSSDSVVAELAGATGGVGFRLLRQQVFDMARRAGLDAATGVSCADRAGRVDADRKYRVSLSERMTDIVMPSEAEPLSPFGHRGPPAQTVCAGTIRLS